MTDTTTAKPAKPDVRFHVTITDGDSYTGGTRYRHFAARAYILAPDKYADSTTPVLHDPDAYGIAGTHAPELKGLVITAQADSDSMARPGSGSGSGSEWYSWTVAYDRHQVTLTDAEQMIPVLRKIKRRMDKLTAEQGSPATLAQFCTRAASAVTPERHAFLRTVPAERDYEGTGYQSMDADALAYHVRSDATEWRKNHGIDPA